MYSKVLITTTPPSANIQVRGTTTSPIDHAFTRQIPITTTFAQAFVPQGGVLQSLF